MKRSFLILFLFALLVSLLAFPLREASLSGSRVHEQVQGDANALRAWYDREWTPLLQKGSEEELQAAFARGRKLYKKIEWAVSFFLPATADELNGAPLPEIEAEENMELPPSGFGVLEALLYPFEPERRPDLLQESRKLGSLLYRLSTLWEGLRFRNEQVWAAFRFQVLRSASLDLSGFDTPLSFTSLDELPVALQALDAALRTYHEQRPFPGFDSVFTLLQRGKLLLAQDRMFNSFNRARLIREVLRPLSLSLLSLQQALGIPQLEGYALNLAEGELSGTAVFNPLFFAPGRQGIPDKARVALGRELFREPLLSGSGTLSWAGCHRPDKAFTDGLATSRHGSGHGSLNRNVPTLLYAGLQQSQFYDMRAPYLEDQVRNVIESPEELNGSLPRSVRLLNGSPQYRQWFQQAFGPGKDPVTGDRITSALAAYIRSLAPFSSPFDRYLQGKGKLSADEEKGFNLFMGKAKCGTCHFQPLFNGTVPPFYTASESEVIGVPAKREHDRVDEDPGRFAVTPLEVLRFSFKTPTLRNISRTAPYMHNGVFRTLEEVLHFYNEGGALGKGQNLAHQTLPPDKLHLSLEEQKQVIQFLQTLTDTGPF